MDTIKEKEKEKEEEEETSFKSRVDKIFGSLSTSLKPAWSLTGDEIEKKEWRRRTDNLSDEDDDDDDEVKNNGVLASASSSNVILGQKKKRNEFGDDENESGGGGDEEWDIRSSIGLDPTLDFEAEEDEYDKVAEGRENAGDRLYMSDVTDHGPFLNSHNVLPHSVHEAVKDSRANHLAAKARLEEDKAESAKFRNPLSGKVNNKPKPVLKMKDSSSSSKAQRRVRFEPYIKNNPEESNTANLATSTPSVQTTAADYQAWVENSPTVPDYLLNPTKYTRYTFDSTREVDDMEVLDSIKRSDCDGVPPHQPKFTPRKKESGATPMDSSSSSKDDAKHSGVARVIATEEIHISDDMDVEGEQGVEKADNIRTENQKPNRRYRPRANVDDPIS